VISNVYLTGNNDEGSKDDTLYLTYLDGTYNNGQYVHIPVIPRYTIIHFTIDGIKTSMEYSQILGANNLFVADVNSNTIEKRQRTPVTSIEATTGTYTSTIAVNDEPLVAQFTITLDGSVELTNTYRYDIVRPPPRPRTFDPLHAYVDVFINGKQIERVTLPENDIPNEQITNDMNTRSRTITCGVNYEYAPYVTSMTKSFDVEPGDLVEFFIYGHIDGQMDDENCRLPSRIDGNRVNIRGITGTAEATVEVISATVLISN
jgi:hypothetical protein